MVKQKERRRQHSASNRRRESIGRVMQRQIICAVFFSLPNGMDSGRPNSGNRMCQTPQKVGTENFPLENREHLMYSIHRNHSVKEGIVLEYLTSMQAAELTGLSKRYINTLCANGEIPGAYKKGYRWMIPAEAIASKTVNRAKAVRSFNTTGICVPAEHYMVDLNERLAQVRILVDDGKYFTINRARQFGKTTTLHALADYLNHEYYVVSMDFQMQMSSAKFKSENRL